MARYRPTLERLDRRDLPSSAALPWPVPPPVAVIVATGTAETVLDLRTVFAGPSGLKLAVLGNTNPDLVRLDLSGASLTLFYAPGRTGVATLTLGATDADGVSVQVPILVTVGP